MRYRHDLASHISYMEKEDKGTHRLLALVSRERLERVLAYLLDEDEFLSPYGIRSLSKFYEKKPFVLKIKNQEYTVSYEPGVSTSGMFGGNSNWRGPIWFPLNYLIVDALKRFHYFYGDSFKIACPTGSDNMMTLKEVASEICRRLMRIFEKDEAGARPVYRNQPTSEKLSDDILFYEYFHGDDGSGLGASHQTGWTALIAEIMKELK